MNVTPPVPGSECYLECKCKKEHPYCYEKDGFCYKDEDSYYYSYDTCTGTCTGHYSEFEASAPASPVPAPASGSASAPKASPTAASPDDGSDNGSAGTCQTDPPGWIDSSGANCGAYEISGWCGHANSDLYAANGIDGDQACCECGGGRSTTASPEDGSDGGSDADSDDGTLLIVIFVVVGVVLIGVAATLMLIRQRRIKNNTNRECINPPGSWSFFLSHTQRHPGALVLAESLFGDLPKHGCSVWLDVKMKQRSEAAMKEGVQNSSCVIAIITGPVMDGTKKLEDQDPTENAYFKRSLCVQELRWAREANVPIQPVVLAADKTNIMAFRELCPDDLKDLWSTDFIHLDRSDLDYWETGMRKLVQVSKKAPRNSCHGQYSRDDQPPRSSSLFSNRSKGKYSAQISPDQMVAG